MNEDDDDDDDSNLDDADLSPDEDLEMFYKKNGLKSNKPTSSSNNPLSNSSLNTVVQDPKTNNLKSATAQLISVQAQNI